MAGVKKNRAGACAESSPCLQPRSRPGCLPEPRPGYRLDEAPAHIDRFGERRFETLLSAQAEDLKRARLLRKFVGGPVPNWLDREEITALADGLHRAGRGDPPPDNPASSVRMREHRMLQLANLWQFVEHASPVSFAIQHRDWVYTPQGLLATRSDDLLGSLRVALHRAGVGRAAGILFGGIHGRYNLRTDRFEVHGHFIGTGGVPEAVRNIKKQRAYKTVKARHDPQFVRVGQSPLEQMPYPLTYTVQSWWPAIWTATSPGKYRKSGRRRLPEPAHTAALIWRSRHHISDLILKMNMRESLSGFIATQERI